MMLKHVIPFLIFVLVQMNLNACCAGGILNVYPNDSWLSDTPIILIEWMEESYRIYDRLDYFNFYLVNEFGNRIELEIKDKVYPIETFGQIILQPISSLKENSEVSMIVEIDDSLNSYQIDIFIKTIEKDRCWEIKSVSDKIEPIISGNPSVKSENKLFGMSNILRATIGIDYYENLSYEYIKRGSKKNFLLGKITNEKGAYYYVKIIDCQFVISDSSCGRIFNLDYETEYLFNLQLVDLSGNRSREKIDFKFKTAKLKKYKFREGTIKL